MATTSWQYMPVMAPVSSTSITYIVPAGDVLEAVVSGTGSYFGLFHPYESISLIEGWGGALFRIVQLDNRSVSLIPVEDWQLAYWEEYTDDGAFRALFTQRD